MAGSSSSSARAYRGLTALSLLGLVVVASADRALLASRPGAPGNLHAVAVTTANYWVTNGNGTFTYSAYSPLSSPNSAYSASAGGAGAAITLANSLSGNTANLANAIGQSFILSYTGLFKGSGINSITFPSKGLGVAVGAQVNFAIGSANQANIMITVDGGLTWMTVTGLPSVTGAQATTTDPYYPAVTAGDLHKVYCTTKSNCWAVGGSFGGGHFDALQYAINPDPSWTLQLPGYSNSDPALGMSTAVMYYTTNGATVWKSVQLYQTLAEVTAAQAIGTTALNAMYAKIIPGELFSISADSAGRNLWAVGSPTITFSTYFLPQRIPTILYSGNAGANWVSQTAPAAPSLDYALFDVAVVKRTSVFAVGGKLGAGSFQPGNANANPPILAVGMGSLGAGSCPQGYFSMGGCNGQIIYTSNGGYSWVQANYPGNTGVTAPTFNSVSVNGNAIWVGGYTRQDAFYPVTPVAATAASPAVVGQNYNILVSFDGVKFVPAASYASFPAGFVLTGSGTIPGKFTPIDTVAPNSAVADNKANDVHGIMWDNNVRGYIYGNGFIMGTHDAGKTWTYETPNGIAVAKGSSFSSCLVRTMANVPTTY